MPSHRGIRQMHAHIIPEASSANVLVEGLLSQLAPAVRRRTGAQGHRLLGQAAAAGRPVPGGAGLRPPVLAVPGPKLSGGAVNHRVCSVDCFMPSPDAQHLLKGRLHASCMPAVMAAGIVPGHRIRLAQLSPQDPAEPATPPPSPAEGESEAGEGSEQQDAEAAAEGPAETSGKPDAAEPAAGGEAAGGAEVDGASELQPPVRHSSQLLCLHCTAHGKS